MPYIDRKRRTQIAKPEPRHGVNRPNTVGELTWLLSEVVEAYHQAHTETYARLADVVVALEQTKHEFQNRVIDPYEQRKRLENGPVFRQKRSLLPSEDP